MITSANPTAQVSVTDGAGGIVVIRLAGDWLLGSSLPSAGSLADTVASAPGVSYDAVGLGRWDTGLLTFVLPLAAQCRALGIPVDSTSLPPGIQRLQRLAEAVPEKKHVGDERAEYPVLEWIGLTTLSAQASAGQSLAFVGQSVLSLVRFAAGRARYRRRDLLLLIQQAGVEALPIVALVAFLLGLILAFVGAIQLQQFGASVYVADLVGIAMVRDMGALITAIVMAGRSGAAYAAQLGTMQVNEEIDALRTMGIDPHEFLVLPRMVALVIMMPLLTLFADFVGIGGGLVVGVGMLDLSFTAYFQQTTEAISLTHLFGGLFKGAVYGILIAIAGTLRGMQSGRSAGAVGQAATSAVVTAIVWIIAAAGLFSFVFYLLGW